MSRSEEEDFQEELGLAGLFGLCSLTALTIKFELPSSNSTIDSYILERFSWISTASHGGLLPEADLLELGKQVQQNYEADYATAAVFLGLSDALIYIQSTPAVTGNEASALTEPRCGRTFPHSCGPTMWPHSRVASKHGLHPRLHRPPPRSQELRTNELSNPQKWDLYYSLSELMLLLALMLYIRISMHGRACVLTHHRPHKGDIACNGVRLLYGDFPRHTAYKRTMNLSRCW